MNPSEIIEALKIHKRLGTHQLGRNKKVLVALAEAGVIAENGTIQTGGRGRPPIAWVLIDADKLDEVELSKPRKRGGAAQVKAMHEGKRKAKQLRDKEELEARKTELEEHKAALPGYEKKYDASIKKCRATKSEEDIKKEFDNSDRWQNAIISTHRQIKRLEELVCN